VLCSSQDEALSLRPRLVIHPALDPHTALVSVSVTSDRGSVTSSNGGEAIAEIACISYIPPLTDIRKNPSAFCVVSMRFLPGKVVRRCYHLISAVVPSNRDPAGALSNAWAAPSHYFS